MSTQKLLYYKTYELGPDYDWVVLVHGAGGSSSIWFRQIKAFRKHFNVLMVDLRGHGRSKDFLEGFYQDTYTFEAVSRDVVAVLDHLQIERAHFVGISLGSLIIRQLEELVPERMISMVMGGAVTRLNIRSRLLVSFGTAVKRLVPYMWLYRLLAWIIMPRKRHAESRNLFIREAKKLAQKEFFRWSNMTTELIPLLKLFHEQESRVPALYLMGGEDYMFLPPVKQLVRRHKNALLQVIEQCGHVCNVEQPEAFNSLALDFLKTHRQ